MLISKRIVLLLDECLYYLCLSSCASTHVVSFLGKLDYQTVSVINCSQCLFLQKIRGAGVCQDVRLALVASYLILLARHMYDHFFSYLLVEAIVCVSHILAKYFLRNVDVATQILCSANSGLGHNSRTNIRCGRV